MDAGILKKLYSGSADLNKSVENINSTLDDLYKLQKKENKREQKEETKKDKERRRKEQEAKRKAGDKKSLFDKMKAPEKKKERKTISQMLMETLGKLGSSIMGILGGIGSVVGGSLLGAISGLGLTGMLTAAVAALGPALVVALKAAAVAAAAGALAKTVNTGKTAVYRQAGGTGRTKKGVTFDLRDINELKEKFHAHQMKTVGVLEGSALAQFQMYEKVEAQMRATKKLNDEIYTAKQELEKAKLDGDTPDSKIQELEAAIVKQQKQKQAEQKKTTELFQKLMVTDKDLIQQQINQGRRDINALPRGYSKKDFEQRKLGTGLTSDWGFAEYNDGPQKRQTGGMIQTLLEPGEKVFMPGQWEGTGIDTLNDIIPRFQTGGVVQGSHPHTGAGYSVGNDYKGRPAIFSKGAAEAYMQMIKDSGGAVKTSDINSSKRSASYNKQVGGVAGSNHLTGNAADIQTGSSSWHWIKKNGGKYGWKFNNYMGPQGWHFDYNGAKKDETGETPTGETKGDPSMSGSAAGGGAGQQQGGGGGGGLSLQNLGGVGGFIQGFMGEVAGALGGGIGEIVKLVQGTAGGQGAIAGAGGFGQGIVEGFLGAVGLGAGGGDAAASGGGGGGGASGGGGGAGGASVPVTPGAKGLLDFIARYESGGSYNKVFGGAEVDGLTDMTIEEVVKYQKAHLRKGYESAAIGRYQMMYPEVYAQKAGLKLTDKFSPANQDKMAMVYLEEDGYSKFKAGKMSADQFANNVAGTWAAMPMSSGRSAHAGVGSNKSLVSRGEFMKHVNAAKLQTGGIVNVTGGHSQTRARLQAAQEQFANRIVSATQKDPVVVFEDEGDSGTMIQEPSPYTELPDLPDGPSTVQAAEYFYNVSLGGEL